MMDDLISRRDAINAVSEITTTMSVCTNKDECYGMKRMQKQAITELENMPSAEPEHPDINVGNMDDCISRKAAIGCLNNVSFDCSMDQEVVEEELLKLLPVHPTISKTENVDDTISRQAAIEPEAISEWKKEFREYVDSLDIKRDDWKGIIEYIDELPSAQPEIIYCKDCKWCVEHYDTDGNVPYWICKNWDAGTDADGFCHEAERREDE